eukprot:1898646-Alexandrium_andersonii.AAC.1
MLQKRVASKTVFAQIQGKLCGQPGTANKNNGGEAVGGDVSHAAGSKFWLVDQFDTAGFALEGRLTHIASHATLQLMMAQAADDHPDVLDGVHKKLKCGERLFAVGFKDGEVAPTKFHLFGRVVLARPS